MSDAYSLHYHMSASHRITKSGVTSLLSGGETRSISYAPDRNRQKQLPSRSIGVCCVCVYCVGAQRHDRSPHKAGPTTNLSDKTLMRDNTPGNNSD